jgi:hypothetical protein
MSAKRLIRSEKIDQPSLGLRAFDLGKQIRNG